jgi:hypothetical protein
MRPLLCLAALLLGCPSTGPENPAPEIPDLSGEYTLVFSQANTECFPPDHTFLDIFGIFKDVDDGTPVTTATFAQDGTQLAITLHSSDCTLEGGVGEEGSFNATGPCHDAAMDRQITVAGDANRSGMDGWAIDANAVIDVDSGDGAGGAPDGETDCTVTEVTVTGTGAPAD